MRCDRGASCQALWNDLDGRRATFRNLARPRCQLSTAPAQWRTRIAYGLSCTGSAKNRKRSGLYVKTGSRQPVRLPRPKDAVRFAITNIADDELRSTRTAAVAADVYEYSFSQTVGGRDMWSSLLAASEGDSDAHVRGIALGRANVHWTLTNSTHAGDPNEAIVLRQHGDCLQRERLVSAPGAEGFSATSIAVDETTIYLVVPESGVVTHTFTPDPALRCAAPGVAYRRLPRLCSDAASRRPSPCAGRSVAVTWRQ